MSSAGHRRHRDTAIALGLAAIAVTLSVTAAPAPAAAHPFGDPQTVDVAAHDQRPEVVRVRWRVGGTDDLALLGVTLGLLPRDRVRSDGAVEYRITDAALIAGSASFAAYLLSHVTVSDHGRSCSGAVAPPRALTRTGATIEFTCPGPVDTATVTVRMLTDLNPAYRALATGPDGQRAVYEVGRDVHEWVLTGAPDAGGRSLARSALGQLGAVAVGVLLAVAALLLSVRHLKRRKAAA
ncbi:hypothetical protein ACFOOK_31825 [Micromonospora krabiensis]|uniref:Uncharacterized protein n=1 Tax=Micromonospora krabiensis TaxID=307121 RepID=A0A1C3MYA2_9ACTN|nr:hypothetical protein [Micromonospora krabiensis]SBV25291.1 hypothetical protein GA0070620_0762 [Micromonospora krabiensis]